MPDSRAPDFGPAVHVDPGPAGAGILLVCEHASNRIPAALGDLGLTDTARQSHIAWDPGALPLARALADLLQAPLVYGGASRLVYDCNRPPEAPDAIPARSEIHDIPGNAALTDAQRAQRTGAIYHPFRDRLAGEIRDRRGALHLMVTIHSFNPVYHGKRRAAEIGLLHGTDADFATRMLAATPEDLGFSAALNEPYSAADGVAHTLDLHGNANGLANVMIEIRNDLIATPEAQTDMAALLAPWIADTLAQARRKGAA